MELSTSAPAEGSWPVSLQLSRTESRLWSEGCAGDEHLLLWQVVSCKFQAVFLSYSDLAPALAVCVLAQAPSLGASPPGTTHLGIAQLFISAGSGVTRERSEVFVQLPHSSSHLFCHGPGLGSVL